MITYSILLILVNIFKGLTSPLLLLSDASLPANISNAFDAIAQYLGYINSFIPVNSFISVFIFILTFEGGYLIFRIIKFILSRT